MNNASGATFSGVAAAGAAVATQQAHEAKRERCMLVVEKYEPKSATVVQMQDYADCVRTLHPSDMPLGAIIYIKIWIVIFFASVLIGAYRDNDWVWGAIMGAGVGIIGPFTFALFIAAIGFLFS